jgi:hypothetical protein
MSKPQRFDFVERADAFGVTDFVPQIPLTLSHQQQSLTVETLLDTGASVNVLPHNIGIQLGAIWREQTTVVTLAGNLAATEARGLLLQATIANFTPVRLVFAWSESDDVPLLLGRTNFLQAFDVCFYGAQRYLTVIPNQ